MFEIWLIGSSGRSSFLKRDTLFEARETAREAAAMTRCEVEIVDRRTGDVVERHELPAHLTWRTVGDDGPGPKPKGSA